MRADTGTIGAPSRNEPATSSRISRRATSMVSASTRSDLVRATRPARTRSRRQMSKCSRVCGFTDSSAATTSTTQVDAADAREHVLDEPLVSRHIDEGEVDPVDLLVREAEIDGDPAGLLFLQPVRVGSRQRQHERALPVIDVPRRADDDRFHGHRGTETQRRMDARPDKTGPTSLRARDRFGGTACNAGRRARPDRVDTRTCGRGTGSRIDPTPVVPPLRGARRIALQRASVAR